MQTAIYSINFSKVILFILCDFSLLVLLYRSFFFVNFCMGELSQVGNTAIIVDPSSMEIISKATDQTHQLDGFLKRNRCVNVEADGAHYLAETTEDNEGRLLLSSSHVSHCLNLEVSCINSWGWTKQRSSEQKTLSSEGCFLWHPLRHAAVVAIENAAERDRMLFHTSTSPTTESNLNGVMENCSDNEPAKRPKIVTKVSPVTYIFAFNCRHFALITLGH